MTNVKQNIMETAELRQSFSTIVSVLINDVQTYFIESILAGEFTVKLTDRETVGIEINGYPFRMWILNGAKHLETWGDNLMKLPITPDNRDALYNALMDKAKGYYEAERRAQRIREFDKIKAELEMYSSVTTSFE